MLPLPSRADTSGSTSRVPPTHLQRAIELPVELSQLTRQESER